MVYMLRDILILTHLYPLRICINLLPVLIKTYLVESWELVFVNTVFGLHCIDSYAGNERSN